MRALLVKVANIDANTGNGVEGYQDNSCRHAMYINPGTSYILRVATGPAADENLRAWLDFDGDSVFNPATEQSLASTGRQHTGYLTSLRDWPQALAYGCAQRLIM